jgi:hypothetical protein
VGAARAWIESRLLSDLWPDALRRVLNPAHKFSQTHVLPNGFAHGFAPLATGHHCSHEGMRNDDDPRLD